MTAVKLLLFLLLTAPLSAPLSAQVAGTWKLAAQPDLAALIDRAIAPMNFLKRPIARGRLKKTNPAYTRIQITGNAAEITIQYDARKPQHMPADGHPVPWRREDGERFSISARLDKETLIQTYQAKDGKRINVFHRDPATGGLALEVQVLSERLPGPIAYTLAYTVN